VPTATGFPALIRAFELALTVEGLRPRTIGNYTGDVRRFFTFLGPRTARTVTSADVREWLVSVRESHAPKTVREAQLGLRRFFRFLKDEGEIRKDPTAEIKLVAPKSDPQPTYTEAEVRRLVLVCSPRSREGVRDRALLLTLFDTGVREGELVSMGLPDWERRRALVSGKTGARWVPFGLATLQALDRYTRRWGVDTDPLWRGRKGSLTCSGVLQAVRRLCRDAGVEHKGVHAFRRAAAAQMKRLGMNDSDILEVMGWRSVEMLRRYTATVAEELARAAHRRHSPADALKSS
jgi:site-specific recombinase XerD